MKIYLLNPPFLDGFVRCGRWQGVTARGGTLDYPKWLAYTTGILEKEGNSVQLRDAIANKYSLTDVIEEIKNFNPDIVIAESNFSSLGNDINVLQEIKTKVNQKIITILTGPPTAVYPEKIIERDCIDVIARFEYDFVIRDFVRACNNHSDLNSVDGIWYNDNRMVVKNKDRQLSTSEELDELPFVSAVYQKHLNIRNYYLSQSLYPEIQIFTGRGCPFMCSFCSWPENLMGRKLRFRSIGSIVAEFQYVVENLPFVKEIFIEDDTFTLQKERVRTFCREMINRKIKITWSCNARADLDFETLKLMKKSGCRLIIVGYESGSDEILKSIKKGITIEQAKQFTVNAKNAGLLVHGDFIIGLPGETHETAQATLNYIKEIEPDIIQVAVATPIPGTAFYDYVKNNGYLTIDDMSESIDENGYQKCIVSYPGFSKDDIEKWVNRILKTDYLNPRYVIIFIRGVFRGGGLDHAKCVVKAGIDFLEYIGKSKAG
ncbi:MAG: radical SAM protein [Candidatus Cloacimonetes bacterium]|nr:radical SAM protein [Candidatus Cloacimonadota bacterium]